METKTVRKGEILAKKGTSSDVLWYIADGTVHMKVGKAAVPLTKGDLIGLADIQSGIHSCDYVAATDIQVSVFATRENLHKTDFLSSRPDNCRAIALSINGVVCNLFKSLGELNSSVFKMLRITHKAYETYCNYAAFLHTTPQEIEEMEFLPKEEASDIRQSAVSRMHAGMHALLSGKESGQNLVEYHVVPGYILHSSSDIMELCPQVEATSDLITQCLDICMNESGDDIYDRLLRLYMRATSDHQLADPIKTLLDEIYEAVFEIDPRIAEIRKAASDVKISQEKAKASSSGKADRDIAAKLAGSMDTILEFANYPSDKASEIRKAIGDFKKVSDPMSTEDDVRQLRMTIEENFYQLYIAVLEERIKAGEVPVIIKMFLNFGYLDEELAGIDNACELYNLALTFEGNKKKGVYTACEWLLAILRKEKEPSINEFDQNYEEYLKDQKTSGNFKEVQVKAMMNDQGQKLIFELSNMFRRTSRICSGQILTFVPVFCEYQLMRPVSEDIIDVNRVLDCIDRVRAVDYSVFYRESMFVYSEKEGIYDTIHTEVLPDIILMPVIGSRAVMWQEIVGKDRMTPARFVFPVISVEDPNKLALKIIGEYRWEICKRIQGARWNDVTDPSITSLYCDYLQFYRKNSDLSAEQKEKVKTGLGRFKQVYKDYFVNDYTEYIRYEASGSPHLNKVARYILFMQCPFCADIRLKLAGNPIYADVSDKLKIRYGQQLHKLENIRKKLVSHGNEVPQELEDEMNFYGS